MWPLATELELESGFELYDYPWWSSTLPCQLPPIARSGIYTLRMAAFDTGTLDLTSNISTAEFILNGGPFVDVTTDKATYSMDGDTVVISLDVDVPYDLTADVYVLMLAPDGQFWLPMGFGEATCVSNIAPIIPSITLDGGFTFSGPAFVASLPADAPFDTPGQFTLFSALVEPGTLTPFSDIGTATYRTISQARALVPIFCVSCRPKGIYIAASDARSLTTAKYSGSLGLGTESAVRG